MNQAPGTAPGTAAGTDGSHLPGTAPGSAAGPGCSGELRQFPRLWLAQLPTPLASAPRLGGTLGAGRLYIKRDDLTGFAFGGNKARQLEFLLAAALAEGADTLVTGGALGSNFCAAVAAAAVRAGLSCHLVIAGDPSPPGPALALARSWGATVTWTGSADRTSVDTVLPSAVARLTAGGRRPYLIPRGGATGLGAVGYALAALELHRQLTERGIGAARVITPVGSGGTVAGLVAGHVLLGRPWTLVGASVSRPPGRAADRVLTLARECLRLLVCPPAAVPDLITSDVVVTDARGPGHGLPSPAGTAAADQAMRTEGLMVDPVYTAKALALVGQGGTAGTEAVVFWHTGGVLDAVSVAQEAQW